MSGQGREPDLARKRTGGLALAVAAAIGMQGRIHDLRPKAKPAGCFHQFENQGFLRASSGLIGMHSLSVRRMSR
jgi:hypothetical protein